MEILVLFLAILVFSSIILMSMVAFRVAIATLLKINSIEKEIIEIKNKKKEDELYCEYSGLPSPKAYEEIK